MIRTTILEILRARKQEWLGAQALADQAFIGLRELAQAVAQIRQTGYEIEYHPRFGYRFVGAGRRLQPYELQRGLGTAIVGRRIIAYDHCASTNDIVWSRAAEGEAEGFTVFAEEQNAGRGRMGRRWECPSGKGLLMSVLLRPRLQTSHQPMLTIMAAVAAARALQETYQAPALIRWPNDILLRDKKVGGILVETRSLEGEPVFVLGLGLNTGVEADEFPEALRPLATSLNIELGRGIDRVRCARVMLRSLDRWYAALRRDEHGIITEEWRQLSSTLGRRVVLADSQQDYHGRVLDLSLEEGLILRLDSGVTRVFPPGRFTLKREGDVGGLG